jgi:hypothetical protein
MDAYVTADAKGDQQIGSVAPVAMMNHQRGALSTTSTAKAVPHEHPFAQTAKKAQRMMPPIITWTAATKIFQCYSATAGTEKGQLNCLPAALDWAHRLKI